MSYERDCDPQTQFHCFMPPGAPGWFCCHVCDFYIEERNSDVLRVHFVEHRHSPDEVAIWRFNWGIELSRNDAIALALRVLELEATT